MIVQQLLDQAATGTPRRADIARLQRELGAAFTKTALLAGLPGYPQPTKHYPLPWTGSDEPVPRIDVKLERSIGIRYWTAIHLVLWGSRYLEVQVKTCQLNAAKSKVELLAYPTATKDWRPAATDDIEAVAQAIKDVAIEQHSYALQHLAVRKAIADQLAIEAWDFHMKNPGVNAT